MPLVSLEHHVPAIDFGVGAHGAAVLMPMDKRGDMVIVIAGYLPQRCPIGATTAERIVATWKVRASKSLSPLTEDESAKVLAGGT